MNCSRVIESPHDCFVARVQATIVVFLSFVNTIRVGGPIIVTNSPREQKKNKVNVCSILVNRKKKYILGSSDSMIFGYFFIFVKFLKFNYKGAY